MFRNKKAFKDKRNSYTSLCVKLEDMIDKNIYHVALTSVKWITVMHTKVTSKRVLLFGDNLYKNVCDSVFN